MRFLVLGCGHTGTTLVSGILHINGYRSYQVSRLFENLALNSLNQRLLAGHYVADEEIRDFLAAVEHKTKGRWCLKDPRLSETVARFYPHISAPVKIVFNYRHPGATVRSLIHERELHEAHLTSEEMLMQAEDEWFRRNVAILKFLDSENESPVLLSNYDDLVDRRLDETLCRFVGHTLDLSFIQPSKRRSTPIPVRHELLDLYEELNSRMAAITRELHGNTNTVQIRVAHRATLRTRAYLLSNRIANSLRSRLAEIRGATRSFRQTVSLF